ncbi:MAG: HAD family hydrolase, partial [Nitrospira sp.]|nr:HAD family hydrolase [Nitrospira sp.]
MMSHEVVFLVDVDNTLLDADRVTSDLGRYLEQTLGHNQQQRYWSLFKQLRDELGYADYLGALQRYRREYQHDAHILMVSQFLLNYPFSKCLFPDALAVVTHLKQRGPVVLVSDGDAVFQPHKIARAGLFDAVDGQVLIYVHKEEELDDIEARYPAEQYVLIDDKLRILSAVKHLWGPRVTTIFSQQGHYA